MDDETRTAGLLADLVSISSLPGHTAEIARYLASALEMLGYQTWLGMGTPVSWAEDPQGSPAPWTSETDSAFVVALPPQRRDSGLLLFAHIDTEPVPAGSPPFSADAVRYSGHGLADDKAGCAAILLAIEQVINQPHVQLPAVVLAPAKGGGSMGMSQAIRSVQGRSAAIYCHPAESGGGFGQIKTASRGIATFAVMIPGQVPEPLEENTPVSADPRWGISAIERAGRLIAKISGWEDPDIVWLVSDIRSDGRDFQVPGTCRLIISSWFSKHQVSDVEALISGRISQFAEEEGWALAATPAVGLRANPVSTQDGSFVEWAMTAIQSVTSQPITAYDWHAASDIRFPLLHLGVPAVGFGCLAGGFYGGQEWIDRASFSQFVGILEKMMREPWS